MLVEVKATTRFRAVVKMCGSASANRPISAVQYNVTNEGGFKVSGVARSPWSHTIPQLRCCARDSASGFSPDLTRCSTI
jgi:hypothetical protein